MRVVRCSVVLEHACAKNPGRADRREETAWPGAGRWQPLDREVIPRNKLHMFSGSLCPVDRPPVRRASAGRPLSLRVRLRVSVPPWLHFVVCSQAEAQST